MTLLINTYLNKCFIYGQLEKMLKICLNVNNFKKISTCRKPSIEWVPNFIPSRFPDVQKNGSKYDEINIMKIWLTTSSYNKLQTNKGLQDIPIPIEYFHKPLRSSVHKCEGQDIICFLTHQNSKSYKSLKLSMLVFLSIHVYLNTGWGEEEENRRS